jgi:hypothetical protein
VFLETELTTSTHIKCGIHTGYCCTFGVKWLYISLEKCGDSLSESRQDCRQTSLADCNRLSPHLCRSAREQLERCCENGQNNDLFRRKILDGNEPKSIDSLAMSRLGVDYIVVGRCA